MTFNNETPWRALTASILLHGAAFGLLAQGFEAAETPPLPLQVELVRVAAAPLPVEAAPPRPQALPAPQPSAPPSPAPRHESRHEKRPLPPSKLPLAAPPPPTQGAQEIIRIDAAADRSPTIAVSAKGNDDNAEATSAAMANPGTATGQHTAEPATGQHQMTTGYLTPAQFAADYLKNPPPAYPPIAKRRGEEGKVLLRVLVSADGRAVTVDLQQSSGSVPLDEAALSAVRQWRFVPAKMDGLAVESRVQVPIIFRLE